MITFENVSHAYGRQQSVTDISFQIEGGQVVTLLGPSGCGKTTLLRLIAGFERPDRGSLRLGQQLVAGDGAWLAPERRGVGMVFQDYALFPHLNAWRNARFGLARGKGDERVAWLFSLLGLEGLEQRYPHQLSGGQRQRLAMARALAPSPRVVLLDEPFSSLDVEVRLRLRSELSSVLEACDASGVIVTHDPDEALAICDRVAVMRDGVLHQCATPQEIVRTPATPFVGSFVLQRNVIPAQSTRPDQWSCPLGDLSQQHIRIAAAPTTQEECCVLVESKDIEIDADDRGDAAIVGREFLGDLWEYRVRMGEMVVRATCSVEKDYPPQMPCSLRIKEGAAVDLMTS